MMYVHNLGMGWFLQRYLYAHWVIVDVSEHMHMFYWTWYHIISVGQNDHIQYGHTYNMDIHICI